MRVLITILLILIISLLTACPVATEERAPPTPASPDLNDVAYIQAEGHPYSDDADPEAEGAEIVLLWYDTKSELIFFKDVPIKVSIEIFARKVGTSSTKSTYKGEHHIDNHRSNIRIPYEHIKANPEVHSYSGRANIVAHTPQQGDFSIEDILVPLFPKPPLRPPPVPTPAPVPLPKPLPAPSPAPAPAPAPKPTPKKPEDNIINDLAYMKAGANLYSDDADPEWEGTEITLLWYDTKSNLIFPSKYKHITLQANIEILASKAGEYPSRCTESVYKDKLELTFPFDIHIPFDHINANPQTHKSLGIAKIVVHTPQQGDFSIEPAECEYGNIFLYPPEKKPD